MLTYLKAHPVVFEPDEVRILTAAFDQAWQAVQTSGAKYDTEARAEAARAIIARHIIEAAAQGERDQRRLREGALVACAQANLRGAPRHSGALWR